MSRIAVPSIESATGATADIYAYVRKAAGSIPNLYAALGHLSPESLKAVLDAEGVLAAGTLGKKDLETIKLLVSERTGCDYCVAAHAMLGRMAGLQPDALRQIRAGEPTGDAKRDALIRFVLILQTTQGTIAREAFDEIRAAGYTDAQLAEISLAIALTIFTNTFNRINDTDVDFPPVK